MSVVFLMISRRQCLCAGIVTVPSVSPRSTHVGIARVQAALISEVRCVRFARCKRSEAQGIPLPGQFLPSYVPKCKAYICFQQRLPYPPCCNPLLTIRLTLGRPGPKVRSRVRNQPWRPQEPQHPARRRGGEDFRLRAGSRLLGHRIQDWQRHLPRRKGGEHFGKLHRTASVHSSPRENQREEASQRTQFAIRIYGFPYPPFSLRIRPAHTKACKSRPLSFLA